MALDPVTNFGNTTVSTGYDDSALEIVLSAGGGAKLPDPVVDGAYNLTWWNSSDYPSASQDPNKEIIRVTGPAGTGNTKTITRAQEGTSASTKNTAGKTYRVALTQTKVVHDAIKTAVDFVDQDVKSGSSPAIIGTNVTAIPSANVDFSKIGSPTYYTAQHWFDVVQSSGIIDGFDITAGDDITHIDITAGKGVIKITDSELGTTKSFEIGATNELALTPLSVNYIYVDYNAGSPLVAATTDHSTIELNRMFDIGVVYSNTASLHILSAGVHISNLARSEHERLIETVGFTFASGASTTNSSLDILVSAGVWYYGHNRITTDALDTTAAGTFEAIHYGTSSWITDDASASEIDATKYNDGDDVLGNLTVNAYGVQWLYVTSDSDYYVMYGTENGPLATAEAAVPPSQAHDYINVMGELIAKIIVRQSGTIISIIPTQIISYGVSSVANHNELGGLQGGAANEYYHLSSAEKTSFDTIESGADVTDAANVAASGAFMADSSINMSGDTIAKSFNNAN